MDKEKLKKINFALARNINLMYIGGVHESKGTVPAPYNNQGETPMKLADFINSVIDNTTPSKEVIEKIPAAGRAFPCVDKVIFNEGVATTDGTELERGATIVYFKDGTKTVVRKMEGDEDNKETALLYALVKRLFATSVDLRTGEVRSAGLGRFIAETVKGGEVQKKIVKAAPKRDKNGRFAKK